MPFNVLLLPLLGGYVFISHWNHTRFDARRYSGERLIFHAAIAGAVFLGVAFVVTRMVILWKPGLYVWWRQLVPFGYTGTSLLAFALAALTWIPLNRFVSDRDTEQGKAVEQWGDYLELKEMQRWPWPVGRRGLGVPRISPDHATSCIILGGRIRAAAE